jgi:hypothetical protein
MHNIPYKQKGSYAFWNKSHTHFLFPLLGVWVFGDRPWFSFVLATCHYNRLKLRISCINKYRINFLSTNMINCKHTSS